ncbi:DapH/DapD/GlmU-related protein [Anaerorhabdus sp.]|uniref:DapH/DapD/GlmU-related protein n=1 Tax=Anaerorhabdus sp. TaxID=1872524 RepID=UPI002FC804EA
MITKEPTIKENSVIENCELDEYTEVGVFNRLENVVLGKFSYTGEYCILQNVIVKNYANIAAMVRIGATDHPIERPTLHHFTYRRKMFGLADEDDIEFFNERKARKTIIGHDTWIGHGAIIKPGITLGNGCVVGSGAVVTKNVEPYAIVVGNPARILKYRFTTRQIEALEKIAWWNWPADKVLNNWEDFTLSIDEFIRKYEVEV